MKISGNPGAVFGTYQTCAKSKKCKLEVMHYCISLYI